MTAQAMSAWQRRAVEQLKREWLKDWGDWDLAQHAEDNPEMYGPSVEELRAFEKDARAKWEEEAADLRERKVVEKQDITRSQARELGFYMGDTFDQQNFGIAVTLLLQRLESIDKSLEAIVDVLNERGVR